MKHIDPCPFCNSTEVDVFKDILIGLKYPMHVHCLVCGSNSGFFEKEDEAIDQWNKVSERVNK